MPLAVIPTWRLRSCPVDIAPGDSTIEEPRFWPRFGDIIRLPETKEESHQQERAIFCAASGIYRHAQLSLLAAWSSRKLTCGSSGILLGSLVFAETLQAIAQAPLERRGRIGIESHEIPERLAAVTAQPGERVRVRVGVPGDIFANRAVRMSRQLVQRLRIGARVFADQPQQVIIFFRRLL